MEWNNIEWNRMKSNELEWNGKKEWNGHKAATKCNGNKIKTEI